MDTLPDWPTYGLAADARPVLAEAMAAGEPVALATLYAAIGGAPRPPGAQMLVGQNRLSGFLSGGCVEGDVAAHGLRVIETGEPIRLVYGEGSPYPDIRLLCGARIEVLVERILPDDAAALRLLELTCQRRPARWVTNGTTRACLTEDQREPHDISGLNDAVTRLYAPVPRLAVVGSDPTALAIAELASRMEFETTLVRPKGPAQPPALPGVGYMRQDADAALAAIGLDRWTYVAVATHDLLTDETALAYALPSEAAYVGVLGARRRIPERLARLGAMGVPRAALDRMKAPIGLDLGGKAPFEIAVAVMAEIVADWSGRQDHDRAVQP